MPDHLKRIVEAQNSADELGASLRLHRTDRIVFAESCTAGLVAALLGQIPGISDWLCGSAVTYRESVKMDWLDVSEQTLKQKSAESLETTAEMAIGVLRKTEEATLSAAVTGHLGPDAPTEVDGKIFIAVAHRAGNRVEIAMTATTLLESEARVDRQYEAAKSVLELIRVQVMSHPVQN